MVEALEVKVRSELAQIDAALAPAGAAGRRACRHRGRRQQNQSMTRQGALGDL